MNSEQAISIGELGNIRLTLAKHVEGDGVMVVKANVRQRRQDRIKKLTETPINSVQSTEGLRSRPYFFNAKSGHTSDESPAVRSEMRGREDERLNDPEYVWNNRSRLDWDLYGDRAAREPIGEAELLRGWVAPPSRGQIRGKIIICLLAFALIWGMFQLDHPWALKGQTLVTKAMTEDIQFEALSAWYEKVFNGAPSFIPAFNFKKGGSSEQNTNADVLYQPVSGQIKTPFSAGVQGIEVETSPGSVVASLRTGRVIFVGNTVDKGLTIIIQHKNKLQSVYGGMNVSYVEKNDWIEGGNPIGVMGERQLETLYFAVKQDSQYIDPADVIAFD
jgi:stage IV sporulation protein FA